MKIILKTRLKKLGNIGDIIEVKDGYGKNMLIPQGFAVFYNEKNYEFFKTKKAEIEKQDATNKTKAEALKKKILAKDLILIENAGDDGKLYGSVTTVKLAQAINKALEIKDLNKNNVFLKNSLKNVGKFEIIVDLHPEVVFDKEVIIARTNDEATKIKKGEFELKGIDEKFLRAEEQARKALEFQKAEKERAKEIEKAKKIDVCDTLEGELEVKVEAKTEEKASKKKAETKEKKKK